MAYNNFPNSMLMGSMDNGAATSFDINAALVWQTSGDSVALEHSMYEALSNETLKVHVYVTAITGTPNSMTMYMYEAAGAGDDIDQPDNDGAALYTSDVVDYSGGAGWKTHTFTGVTRAASVTTWFILANTHGTDPTLNYPAVQIRGGLEASAGMAVGNGNPLINHNAWSNTSGWTADGTAGGGFAPMIVEYPSGNSHGNPWVANSVVHASNTNYRGNRFTPTEDIQISGFVGMVDSNFASMHVVQGSTDSLNYTISGDLNAQQRAGGARFAAITLTGGLAYDLLQKAGAADTFGAIYGMGTSPPTAVQNAGGPMRHVTGATLGSLTYDATLLYAMFVEIADNPAISGATTTTNVFVIDD